MPDSPPVKILVTGGAGFIGSTIASCLADAGHAPIIIDNLITGRVEFTADHPFFRGDVADGAVIDRIFVAHPDIDAVVHCAALVVVPDSVADPLGYYDANVAKGIAMLRHLTRHGVTRLLYSSSASIYAPGPDLAVDEESPVAPQSPYARSKAALETILADVARATPLRVVSLRYFNPVGTDPQLRSGLHMSEPSHALGRMLRAYATGTTFTVTGTDWPTRDGTGIRDYVHVWDLAEAHVRALDGFDEAVSSVGVDGSLAVNLGTGGGTTVRELLRAVEQVLGEPLPSVDAAPRPGDVAGCYTRSPRATELWGWRARRSIEDGVRDTLRWFAIRDQRLGVR